MISALSTYLVKTTQYAVSAVECSLSAKTLKHIINATMTMVRKMITKSETARQTRAVVLPAAVCGERGSFHNERRMSLP